MLIFVNKKCGNLFFLDINYTHNIFNFAVWPTKPKYLPLGPLTENVCQPHMEDHL